MGDRMGDRCSLWIYLPETDIPVFANVFDLTLGEALNLKAFNNSDYGIKDTGIVYLELNEVNYADREDLIRLAKLTNFYGYHDAGYYYSHGRFVGYNGKLYEIITDAKLKSVVRIEENKCKTFLSIMPSDARNYIKYKHAFSCVKELFRIIKRRYTISNKQQSLLDKTMEKIDVPQ